MNITAIQKLLESYPLDTIFIVLTDRLRLIGVIEIYDDETVKVTKSENEFMLVRCSDIITINLPKRVREESEGST